MGVTASNVPGITPALPAEHPAIGREPRGVRLTYLSGIGRGSMWR
jgi:hypothetical protein